MEVTGGTLEARLLELCDGYVVGARRSIGSFIQIYFDKSQGVKGSNSKGKSSVLIEFAEWTVIIASSNVNQDCEVDVIDRFLPKIVGAKVNSIRLNNMSNLVIALDKGKIILSSSPEGMPDDQAWIFFSNVDDKLVEAWTIMCDNELTYWKGDRLRPAS